MIERFRNPPKKTVYSMYEQKRIDKPYERSKNKKPRRGSHHQFEVSERENAFSKVFLFLLSGSSCYQR